MPKIRHWAGRVEASAPGTAAGAEDLVQVALLGVLRARKRWDPQRGASWKTWALMRARGAMADELRELDHIPRLERSRARREGRELPKVLSLDRPSSERIPPDLADPRAADPAARAAAADGWARLRRLVGIRAGRILELYFREDLTLLEVAHRMGVSESRVSQLVNRSLERLKRKGFGRGPA